MKAEHTKEIEVLAGTRDAKTQRLNELEYEKQEQRQKAMTAQQENILQRSPTLRLKNERQRKAKETEKQITNDYLSQHSQLT